MTNSKVHIVALLLGIAPVPVVLAQQAPTEVPRLVVGITVDQLRTDYLQAFEPLYGDNGLRRLMKEGVVMMNAQYASANIDRASAVASVFTGTVPYNHGVIGEHWIDRNTLSVVSCVEDADYRRFSFSEGYLPKRLLVSSVGDELKVATGGKALVYAFSPFADAAVLSAGHAADAAFWMDDIQGNWTTSSYYGEQPDWADMLTKKDILSHIRQEVWKPTNYVVGAYNYYVPGRADKDTFQHRFSGTNPVGDFKHSGLINEQVRKAVSTCLSYSDIGHDEVTDMIAVTFYAGRYNRLPLADCAIELQDTYVRLDEEIAALLHDIDQRVGLNRTLVFLTSTGYEEEDNGDLKTYRIPSGTFQTSKCAALLNMYLSAIYGPGQYVEKYYGSSLYLNHRLLEDKQIQMTDLLDRTEDFLFQYSGVRDVYTSRRLTQGAWTPGISRLRNAYHPQSSGDILIEVRPGWVIEDEDSQTQRLVRDSYLEFPLFFFGNGLAPERVSTPVTVDCVAPTVTHYMRIRAPNACASRPLMEVFGQ